MRFETREHTEPSATTAGQSVQVIQIVPRGGKYPQNWIRFDLTLSAPLPEGIKPRLIVATSMEQKEPLDFVVNIDSLKSGRVRLLLKMIGEVQGLALRFEPHTEKIKIKKLKINHVLRPLAMASLVVKEVAKAIFFPKHGARLARDSYLHFKQSGSRGTASFLRKHLLSGAVRIKDSYDLWVDNFGVLSHEDKMALQKRVATLAYRPKISILMPVYNTDERWLRLAIESVRAQAYPDWELCVADDKSSQSQVKVVLDEYAALDNRIKVVYRETNGHISEASNSALAIATGDITALLDHDDELTHDALYWIAQEFNDYPETDFVYSDEDKIDGTGRRFHPHFKMNWNTDLFYSVNLVTHLSSFRTSLLREVGGFRKGVEGSQDYDLVLRVFEKTSPSRIRHIPRILYHWRAIPGSTAIGPESKNYAHDAARRAISEHFKRTGIEATVTEGYGSYHRVQYSLPAQLPLVTAIICTRDRAELLRGIVSGLLEKTDYPNLEVLIVDNQSCEKATLTYLESLSSDERVRVIRYDKPFNFADMNNLAAQQAKGEILAFLNNDLLVILDHWLKEMVSFAARPEFGAVGARLLYPTGEVQHAGVVLGIGGVAGHAHRFTPGKEGGYMSRSLLIQSFSAVTAACIVMRKTVFTEVEGFDAKNLAVAFNDVDLCLKIREAGYRIVYTPYAELYHLESASRGSDLTKANRPRFAREIEFMKSKWGDKLVTDPFYNANLTLAGEDYALAFPPRVQSPSATER